jgi:clan AA aspartic protease
VARVYLDEDVGLFLLFIRSSYILAQKRDGLQSQAITHGFDIYTQAKIKAIGSQDGIFEAQFLVDTDATDTLVPVSALKKIGMKPIGKMAYELADGTVRELEFGLAQIEFMGEVTAGRVVFGPEGSEPLLGITAVESVGIVIDPANKTLKRLPAIPLK